MSSLYLLALASVFVVSSVSLAGIFTLSLRENILRRAIFLLVSLAAGALLGDAFIHLIPETFEEIAPFSASLLVIAGILIFFVLEKFLHWHHYHDDHEGHAEKHKVIHPTGYMILVSDGVHNLLDGAIIAASFLAGVPIGLATTLAVILHEIPQEIGDFGVLLNSGFSRMRALFLNFLSALLAVLGALFVLFMGETSTLAVEWLIPVAAGGFIYIAAADLIPEIHKTTEIKNSLLQLVAMISGIAAMAALLFFE